MQARMENSLHFDSPSFNSYSNSRLAEIAAKITEKFMEESSQSRYDDEEYEVEQEQQQQEEKELENRPLTPSQSLNDQPPAPKEQKQEGNEDGDGFEFPVFGRSDPDLSPKPADEIFYNGQIRPIFPIFDRNLLYADGHHRDSNKTPKNRSSHRLPLGKLMIEERSNNDDPPSSSSSEADELENIPDGSYCVWTPKPVEASLEKCKKSNSTGFSKKTWKFRDLLYRSNSDGMDTYVFLSPSKTTMMKRNDKTEKASADRVEVGKSHPQHHHHQHQQQQLKEKSNSVSGQVKVAANKGKVKAKVASGEALSAHESHYVRYRALKEEDRRRSYLPYRQDLVGLFANANGGVSSRRTLHPF
ncbi:uncharacterized protein LOC122077378 [Macadamia integrifolia]|uniref:uncharacterized protein LOC122077378 n=1 Tax=Macadamia integrifolia TaxID=60698 RepID=UPI001C4F5547|nr:uncharacterized protein LOC122077378 [Macadamia integrifolia]